MIKTLALSVVVLVLASCALFAPHDIEYRVTGTGTSLVSWIVFTDDDGVKDRALTGLPWTLTFELPRDSSDYLAVSAWNEESSGTITCAIYVDDDLVDSETDSIMASAEYYM